MSLKGSPQLRARLKALRVSFKPVGRAWADSTVEEYRHRVKKRTGKTARSFRVRNASQRKATVVGSFVANFIDAGTKAHDIKPKKAKGLRFSENGRTIFSKKVHHPRTQGHPFKRAGAIAALRKHPMAEQIVNQWNEAVGG